MLADVTDLTTVMCATPADAQAFLAGEQQRTGCNAPGRLYFRGRECTIAWQPLLFSDGGANPFVCPAQKQVTTWFNNARKRLLHKRIGPRHLTGHLKCLCRG